MAPCGEPWRLSGSGSGGGLRPKIFMMRGARREVEEFSGWLLVVLDLWA